MITGSVTRNLTGRCCGERLNFFPFVATCTNLLEYPRRARTWYTHEDMLLWRPVRSLL